MNNGKYHTESYKQGQSAKYDRMFGPVESHIKTCVVCGADYTYKGRKYTKSYESSRFCGRKCANNRQEWWNSNAVSYKTIALQHHAHECVICGFDKIVAIHHIDENKKNNHPHNLIPLCPNHHEMVHSRYRNEVQPHIDEWQANLKQL